MLFARTMDSLEFLSAVLIHSRFLYSSSSDLVDKEQLTEFWNRDDEVSGSEEDISDSDGFLTARWY